MFFILLSNYKKHILKAKTVTNLKNQKHKKNILYTLKSTFFIKISLNSLLKTPEISKNRLLKKCFFYQQYLYNYQFLQKFQQLPLLITA